ncbi:divalent cation transporter [Methanobrevibacter sp. 87.7]|uniref:magnesium transporter n=1 Tax=Methanobrevibacter sp. 87.7 TaxID=387957 RepID=UPI000B50DF92|nr:magnesium transporter [Methanobrevibacter sp. 87.7]OWT33440.1 divalent cation transporter [Methanobrevibacter sp. 87.7]
MNSHNSIILTKFYNFIKNNRSTLKQSLVALFICAIGDLCAGIILGNMTYFLNAFPGLLILIPGAIGMRGNIFGSFASRLSTNLHIGVLDPEFKKSDVLFTNLKSSFVLTMVLSVFLAVFAKIMCLIFNLRSIDLMDFILISVFAGIISNLIMLPITMFISFKSYKGGWDPDNVTTPLVAAFGDLFTLPAIIASLFILKNLGAGYFKDLVFSILILLIIIMFVYEVSRNKDIKRILIESTPTLLLCSFLGIYAGTVLDSFESTLLTNPTILTLVPLLSGESGNLVSILGARLSSSLHSGLIEPEFKFTNTTIVNLLIILSLAVIVYPFIAIISDLSSVIMGIQTFGLIQLILISVLAGLTLIPIMMMIVFGICILSYKHGFDPDNIVIPISTSITDAFSNTLLIAYSLLIITIFL